MFPGFEKLLFMCDKNGITIPDEDHKKRIIEFIKQNHDPGLSLTAKVEREDANTIKITDGIKTVFLKLDDNKSKVSLQTGNRRDEFIVAKRVPREDGNEDYYIYPSEKLQGPGHKFVGTSGIILTSVYLILLSILIIYTLVRIWPTQASALSSENSDLTVTLLLWPFQVTDEGRMFLIVSLAGALGSVVHANRSFYTYVGERKLLFSWLLYYIILPFSGAILGLIFYIAVRGGLFAQSTVQQTSPFGFAAVAALVGLFSVQALAKLEEVANTVFTKPPERSDSFKEKSPSETQAKGNDKAEAPR